MNDLETLSAGDIQPYSEGMPVLAPLSPTPDTWGNLLREDHQHQSGGGLKLFGETLPAGTTRPQVDAILGQLGGSFMADFGSLGFPSYMVQAALAFMTANATKAPYQVTREHNFNLHGQDDWLGNAFGNMVEKLSGTPRQKQQFVTACIQWLVKVNKQLKPGGSGDMPRTAPNSTEHLLNQLSDADYNKVIKINNDALARTMDILAAKWGSYVYKQNIEIAQNYLNTLPANERAHFDQFTTGWVAMLNTPEALEALYGMAIGAGSLPQNGADIAREIASIEHCMKYERKVYLANPQLQARYRTLLDLKG